MGEQHSNQYLMVYILHTYLMKRLDVNNEADPQVVPKHQNQTIKV